MEVRVLSPAVRREKRRTPSGSVSPSSAWYGRVSPLSGRLVVARNCVAVARVSRISAPATRAPKFFVRVPVAAKKLSGCRETPPRPSPQSGREMRGRGEGSDVQEGDGPTLRSLAHLDVVGINPNW